MTTTTPAPPAEAVPPGYRTTTGQIMRYLAMAGGTLTVIQFALAGFGAFSAFQHHRGFGAHETVGTIIGVFTVLVLIAALIARPSTSAMINAAVLFVLAGPAQPILANIGKDHAWVGALHALVGIAILALFGRLSARLNR
jgi:hypothetical protein